MAYHSKYTGAEVDALLDKIAVDNVGDIDSALSTTSENPVMNKVITEELDKKVNKNNMATINGKSLTEGGNIEVVADSYDDTGIKKDISDLKENDALQDAKLTELSDEVNGNAVQTIQTQQGIGISTSKKHPLALKAGAVKATFVDTDNVISVSYVSLYFYDAQGVMCHQQGISEGGTSFVLNSDVVEFGIYVPNTQVINTGIFNIIFDADGIKQSFRDDITRLEDDITRLENKILPKDSVTPSQLEDYSKLPLLEGFKGSSSQDYNSYISEFYIEPSYVDGDTIVGLRRYSTGIILRAFNPSTRWSINNYTIMDGKSNGDVIPLVITSASDSSVVGKTIGYMIFRDIDGFKKLMSDGGDGQLLNLALCTKLFTQPNIWESLRIVQSATTPSQPSSESNIAIYLPQQLTAVVGDKFQIFFRSIVDVANTQYYDILAVCSKGKSYPRYWEYVPTSEDAGKSVTLKVIVRGKADSILATKQTTINFVSARTSPSSNKNILCIGASATAGGQWVGELKRRLTDTSGDGSSANPTGLGLSNFSFVGRKQGSVNPVSLEATGGWKVSNYGSKGERAFRLYVTNVNQLYIGDTYTSSNGGVFVVQEINVTEGVGNIRCTFNSSVPTISASGTLTKTSGSGDATIQYTSYADEFFSPFFNTSTNKIDFKTYANDWCGGSIDLMIWHCGVNDIFGGTDAGIDSAISTFGNILTQYHADFPNGKVIISSVPLGSMNGGFAANYGASETANGLTFMRQAQKYAERLQELVASYSSYAHYSPVMEEFDAEYGYPTKNAPVNNRASETEVVGTNAVHPTDAGSYMVADAIYRTINAMNL